jgi:murein L,D-transpeptidase YcbB/YkuD
MIKQFFCAALLLTVTQQPVMANVEDYKIVDKEVNAQFLKQLQAAIKKSVSSASEEVQGIYQAIGYRPVWVKKDELSADGVMLLGEIKDDLDHGALTQLKSEYETIRQEEDVLSEQTPMEKKVALELHMMQLYIDHIKAILKGTDTSHSAASLLKEALDKESLLHAYNALAKARIEHRTPVLEKNATILGGQTKLDENMTKALTKGSDKARLQALYRALNYQPVWIDEKGLSDYTKALFSTIENDPVFDHSGPTYKLYARLKALPVPIEKKEIIKREFEIAKLYQDYMGYLLYGAIDWKRFKHQLRRKYKHGVWDVHEVLLSPELLLVESVQKGTLNHAFEKAKPKFPRYDHLVNALQKYKKIADAGGWPALPDFKDLKPGMSSPVVPLLRERLQIEGDSTPCPGVDANSTKYDDCLLKAVKKFQARHGLEAEGYIGKKTRKALAETARHKYVRLRLSIARMKWLKRDSNRYHVVANIPDFTITVYDGWEVMEKMRVVTGRKGHETPVFYNKVKRIVLNPYWRIPPSIIRHETLPKLKRDPGYTQKKHIEIHTGYSEHSPEVNPYKVNWHKYGRKLPPYKFMQSPGKQNALGKVKFLFPNKYSVYMHDTPEKALFSRDVRAFSHGCVRLHRPFDMLKTFSEIDPKIDYAKAQKILETNKKTPVRLSHYVPIDIIYISAWVDENGDVQFRDDIYGYDKLHMETAKWLPDVEDANATHEG